MRAVFWICAEHYVENAEMFLLLPSSVYTMAGLSCFSCRPFSQEAGGGQGAGGTQLGHPIPAEQRDMPEGITLSMESCGEEKEGVYIQRGSICLPKSLLPEPGFPGGDRASACLYKWRMNLLPLFACVHSLHCTYLIVFISAHDFSHFHPSNSLFFPWVKSGNL